MTAFLPGLELSRLYFFEAIKPILDAQIPDLRYDAGLIGPGSEVLGFDTPRSTDHHWGCRVCLFLSEPDHARYAEAVHRALRRELPRSFRGYATSMSEIPGEPGVMRFDETPGEDVNHQVLIRTVSQFLRDTLNLVRDQPLDAADWLTVPQQRLRAITAGGVWHSGLGELERLRAQFAYFPHDVWVYLLAAGWARIAQEEAFIGRSGEVGDELGSRVIAARLVRDLMMLCFLMERTYAPYAKWFGTAFARLKCAAEMSPLLERSLRAETWQEREAGLAAAFEFAAAMHNALGLTESLPTQVSLYQNRPFHVIHGDSFANPLVAVIRDPEVKRIADTTLIGGIDQFSDSTDLKEKLRSRPALKYLYR